MLYMCVFTTCRQHPPSVFAQAHPVCGERTFIAGFKLEQTLVLKCFEINQDESAHSVSIFVAGASHSYSRSSHCACNSDCSTMCG